MKLHFAWNFSKETVLECWNLVKMLIKSSSKRWTRIFKICSWKLFFSKIQKNSKIVFFLHISCSKIEFFEKNSFYELILKILVQLLDKGIINIFTKSHLSSTVFVENFHAKQTQIFTYFFKSEHDTFRMVLHW